MNELHYLQIEKENETHFEDAKKLWLPFIHELNDHEGKLQTDDDILNGLRKRIVVQGRRNTMHFEFAILDDEIIGIAMFDIDLGTVYGLLEVGYGTIMGFYIKPQYRRQGYGTQFYRHIENTLFSNGAKHLYITPDAVTGVPFWLSIGFKDSGKVDPDDKKPIFIKNLS